MSRSSRRQGRILVIDDERFIAELMHDVLRRQGYDVDMCATPDDAIPRAERGAYDLVISDFAMPGLNGLEFTRRVQASSPATRVVIVSAYLDSETVGALEAEPCFAGYLRKPFDIFHLTATAERLLGAKDPVRSIPTWTAPPIRRVSGPRLPGGPRNAKPSTGESTPFPGSFEF